ncbi:hypothetical protein FOB72_18115 (plasmid) [Cupriavidus pauculus]|uniref:Uncharacterized protein n=2 Tax=Cupriavidus pauculus TaxID=82633 RepID=A0A5P2H7S8_9BURK|nr:hypothetical protein FOB72_18115 [Cupriavidus pauculus]
MTLATIALAMTATCAHAEGDKSVTRVLLEKDAQIAVQKADQELAKTNPAPVVVTPPAAPSREAHSVPKTVAVFGIDGSKAGLPVTLRSYVKWGNELYAARVGGSVRGYKVISITENGTTFAKGKQTLTAARADDEAVLLEEPAPRTVNAAARPAEPLPGQNPANNLAAPMPFAPSMPAPVPAMAPPVAPASPAAPSVG